MNEQTPGWSRLPRTVGISFGIAVTVGATVGAGILRTPGIVAGYLGRSDLIIVAWFSVGVISLLGANCYAELSTSMPTAGGPFEYVRRAYGDFAGFIIGWVDWVAQVCSTAYLMVTIGAYAASLFRSLVGSERILAIGILVISAGLNAKGMRLSDLIQRWLSSIKVAGLALFVLAVFLFKDVRPHSNAFTELPSPKSLPDLFVSMLLASRVISETYSGWNNSIYFSEDQRDPSRNLPQSMFVGVLLVMVLYGLVNVALLQTLSLSQLTSSNLGVAAAIESLFGTLGGHLVTIFAIATLFGIVNVVVISAPRILLGLARHRLSLASSGRLDPSGTPGIATIFTVVAAAPLIWFISFNTLFATAATLGSLINVVAYLSLFRLRHTSPTMHRPFRAYGYPYLPAAAALLSLLILLGACAYDYATSLRVLGLCAAAALFYGMIRRSQRRRDFRQRESPHH